WLTGRSFNTWRTPLGQRISSCFTVLNLPRPKCARGSRDAPNPALVETMSYWLFPSSVVTFSWAPIAMRLLFVPTNRKITQLLSFDVTVAEDSGFSVQDSHHAVHMSVVEQVADYRTAIWLVDLHRGAS